MEISFTAIAGQDIGCCFLLVAELTFGVFRRFRQGNFCPLLVGFVVCGAGV